jgi:hypothetical protein
MMPTPRARQRLTEALQFSLEQQSPAYIEIRRQQLVERLQQVARESVDIAVNPSAFDYAVAFANLLPAEAPDPEIVIEDDGEVAFDWGETTHSTFSVSIGSDGTLRFGGLFGYQTRYGSDQLVSTIPNEILAYIDRTRR